MSLCLSPPSPSLSLHTSIKTTEFTIQPAVGPNMPLVIPEGGGTTLTCTHVSRPPFALAWYRETSAIRQDTAETLDECGCQVPLVEPLSGNNREVIFMNFSREFAGEYSCRAPITSGIFDICRFNVSAVGELVIQCVFIHVPMCMHQSVCLRASEVEMGCSWACGGTED